MGKGDSSAGSLSRWMLRISLYGGWKRLRLTPRMKAEQRRIRTEYLRVDTP